MILVSLIVYAFIESVVACVRLLRVVVIMLAWLAAALLWALMPFARWAGRRRAR